MKLNKSINQEYCLDLINLYHHYCPELPKVTIVTAQKQRELVALLRKYNYLDFMDLFTQASLSPFLNGKGKQKWQADFNWLTVPENMEKVISDHYSPKRDKWGRIEDLSVHQLCIDELKDTGVIKHVKLNRQPRGSNFDF